MVKSQIDNVADISEREAEVLDLLGEHLTNAEIANRLFISVRTVESHVSSLLRKLGAEDRRALATLASNRTQAASAPDEPSTLQTERPPLPAPLTSFVGRVTERAGLSEVLSTNRLVTALGPGGVGKTRLALAMAAELNDSYRDGAWYVDLVPVSDPSRIGEAVAAAVGLGEQTGRSPIDSLLHHFARAEALVVLDNCEHISDGVAGFVERLLTACPHLDVLATSQTRLLLPFESVFPVPGLSIDDDAVELFVERAAMGGWHPTSSDDRARVAAICRALDGSALAIELAAARLASLGLDGLESGLSDRLELLAGGPRMDERHRSLRSALDWSYRLLDEIDQLVLRQASVFARWFTAEAAAGVIAHPSLEATGIAAALARLADHSLLVVSIDAAATRYRMLETIRQYSVDQLDASGEHDDLHARHFVWCQANVDEVGADDVRAALCWAGAQDAKRQEAYELTLEVGRQRFSHGMPTEAQSFFELAVPWAADDAAAADALHTAAMMASIRLMGDEAMRLFREAGAAARRAGDNSRAAIELTRAVEYCARFLGLLSWVPAPGEAEALLAEAAALPDLSPEAEASILVAEGENSEQEHVDRALELANQLDSPRLWSAAMDELTVLQLIEGDVRRARETSLRRVEYLVPLAGDMELMSEVSDALHMAPMTCLAAGDLAGARRHGRQRLELPFNRSEPHLLVNWLLIAEAMAGNWDEALELAAQFRIGWERAGRQPFGGFVATPAAVALVHGLRGDDEARAEWLDIAMEMGRVTNHLPERTRGHQPLFNAYVALDRNEFAEAFELLSDEPESFHHWHTGLWRQWYAAAWLEAAVLAEHPDRVERLERARSIVVGNPIATALVDRAEALVSGDRDAVAATAKPLADAGCRYQHDRSIALAEA